jgi:hypothetical protein
MPANPRRPLHRSPASAGAGTSGKHVPEKPAAVPKYQSAPRSYRFQRAQHPGIIEVLNEHSYVMAEYSERTSSVKWQRVVAASERDQIENWLKHHYPTS